MTLSGVTVARLAQGPAGTFGGRLLQPDVRVLHHAGPFVDRALQPFGSFTGRLPGRLPAEGCDAFPDVRRGQGTGEGGTFRRAQLDELTDLAWKGIERLLEAQRRVLDEAK